MRIDALIFFIFIRPNYTITLSGLGRAVRNDLPDCDNDDSLVIVMDKILSRISRIIDRLSEQEVSVSECLVAFSGMILLRIFIDFFLASRALSIELIIIEYVHNFLFFSISLILIWMILSFSIKTDPRRLSRLMLWSFWSILFPPILDMLKTGGEVFWSFYLIGSPKFMLVQYLTFLSSLPSGIVYFGTRILFALAVIASGLIVAAKTRNFFRAFLAAILTYLALFLMGAAPSLVAFAYAFFSRSWPVGQTQAYQIIQLFASQAGIFGVRFESLEYALPYKLELVLFPVLILAMVWLFSVIDREKTIAVIKNFRFPQLIYHAGLFLAGLGLGGWLYRDNFHLDIFSIFGALDLLLGIFLAWIASVVPNDLADFQVDCVSNPERPLQSKVVTIEQYRSLGWLFFFLSVFGAVLISPKFAGLMLAYQCIAFAYSYPPYRLKRFLFVASFISASASLVVFFTGFTLVSGDQNIQGLSWRVIFLLLFCYTASLPLKDFKDIAGDARDGVKTVPVVFGEERGRQIVASGIFLSFILSIFLLNIPGLFWWAVLFGSAAFLAVTNKKIHPRKIFWWILVIVIVYGLLLVKMGFGL